MSHAADLGESQPPVPTIEIDDVARTFVMSRGGIVYLRVRQDRCCSGAVTYLDADITPHGALEGYISCGRGSPAIQLLDSGVGLPRLITVAVRGRIRPHLVAYWDGCAYRI